MHLDLTNTGDRAGAEVVQLYVEDCEAPQDRPPQALKGFAKVLLEPGECAEVTLDVPAESLRIFCPDAQGWVLRPGEYRLKVGASSRDIRVDEGFHIDPS